MARALNIEVTVLGSELNQDSFQGDSFCINVIKK